MDATLLAAVIGALATLGAATISGIYDKTEGIQLRRLRSRSPLDFVIILTFSVLVAGLIYAVLYDPTEARIRRSPKGSPFCATSGRCAAGSGCS